MIILRLDVFPHAVLVGRIFSDILNLALLAWFLFKYLPRRIYEIRMIRLKKSIRKMDESLKRSRRLL